MESQAINTAPLKGFSQAEIDTYNAQLNRSYGSKTKVVTLSGFSEQTFKRAMRGEPIKLDTRKKLVKSIMKVISEIQKTEAAL